MSLKGISIENGLKPEVTVNRVVHRKTVVASSDLCFNQVIITVKCHFSCELFCSILP